MKYMGDSNWWNERFKTRALKVMMHEKCLEDDLSYFPKIGKILDIACGDGRNAIYLARLGYEVVAVDFCEVALDRLKYFAEKEGLKIEVRQIDLSKECSFLDRFEAILINHYRLRPELYSHLINHLKKDGVLWVNGFSKVPDDNPNIKEQDVLKESDFISLDNYTLENKKIYEINQQRFIRCIWRK